MSEERTGVWFGLGEPPCGDDLRVCSYNVLAQVYTRHKMFPYAPRSCLKWKKRRPAIVRTRAVCDGGRG